MKTQESLARPGFRGADRESANVGRGIQRSLKPLAFLTEGFKAHSVQLPAGPYRDRAWHEPLQGTSEDKGRLCRALEQEHYFCDSDLMVRFKEHVD